MFKIPTEILCFDFSIFYDNCNSGTFSFPVLPFSFAILFYSEWKHYKRNHQYRIKEAKKKEERRKWGGEKKNYLPNSENFENWFFLEYSFKKMGFWLLVWEQSLNLAWHFLRKKFWFVPPVPQKTWKKEKIWVSIRKCVNFGTFQPEAAGIGWKKRRQK